MAARRHRSFLSASPSTVPPPLDDVEIGSLIPFAGAAVPTGYLLCDGTSKLRAAFPDLFTAIGTTWGAVDGTHFNVPDLRQSVPIGTGNRGLGPTVALAEDVGENSHAITVPELPAHHHSNAFRVAATITGSANLIGSGDPATGNWDTDDTGGGTAIDWRQVSRGVNWIIKALP